eukprot:TRINITY_DN21466_c0_g1_i1.p1 TRINITY_DN21466_c0_g1~~TRINITY_DN21466_c0_g1_i1.p1  ORF type:complete len:435 (+),score=106.39 TRINITY_DN21466_c0_g1_i1:140-1444(+)
MGNYLSEPITEKVSESGNGPGLAWGASAMQGWRTGMEDAHITAADLGKSDSQLAGHSLFAVFDGHGGGEVARFCERHFPPELSRLATGDEFRDEGGKLNAGELLTRLFILMDEMLVTEEAERELLEIRKQVKQKTGSQAASSELEEKNQELQGGDAGDTVDVDNVVPPPRKSTLADADQTLQEMLRNDVARAQVNGKLSREEARVLALKMLLASKRGLSVDSDPDKEGKLPAKNVGCTAVSILLTPGSELICANAGDSRAVLCRKGKALPLSQDHKPNSRGEKMRIEAAGGSVVEMSRPGGRPMFRVNGNLNLSRSIGDLAFKTRTDLRPHDQVICCVPDIIVERVTPDDEFMVLACDGIWDVKSNQEVCKFFRQRILRGQPLEKAVEDLMDECLASDPKKSQGLGCDNMTCIVVVFDHWQHEQPTPSCGCTVS